MLLSCRSLGCHEADAAWRVVMQRVLIGPRSKFVSIGIASVPEPWVVSSVVQHKLNSRKLYGTFKCNKCALHQLQISERPLREPSPPAFVDLY
jgi:hypothetical protein